jgi:glycosyltransferase involved in cell wall biosynthesis
VTEPRTVLVMTYEFPPTGGGGVQRVAKLSRYLPDGGWTPIVVSGAHVDGRPFDPTLLQEVAGVRVVRTPARRVSVPVSRVLGFARRLRDATARLRVSGGQADSAGVPGAEVAPQRGVGLTARITSWVSFPDVAGYWIGPAVRAAVRVGRHEGVEAVFASGPPHSVLVAGSRVAAALGVPFVADMRDAWRDNPGVYHPTSWHRSRALALERRVLATAAEVTCVSEPIAAEAREMGARSTFVLPNGFDPAEVPAWDPTPGDLRIAFMGHMYPAHSDPAPLLDALVLTAQMGEAASRITFDVIGGEASFAVAEVATRGLGDRVRFLGYRPHTEALALLARRDAGVVLIRDAPGAKASYTGKIFEYLGVGMPILVVGPTDGVAAELVRESGGGRTVAYGDPRACAQALAQMAEAKAAGAVPTRPNPDVVHRFDRREQALCLSSILDALTAR